MTKIFLFLFLYLHPILHYFQIHFLFRNRLSLLPKYQIPSSITLFQLRLARFSLSHLIHSILPSQIRIFLIFLIISNRWSFL